MTDRNITLALRAGMIGFATLTLAACQSAYNPEGDPIVEAPRPNFPSRAGDPNPPAPIQSPQARATDPQAPVYNPRPADPSGIDTRVLPPPERYDPPAQAYNPPAPNYNPPAPTYLPRTESRTIVAGPLVDAETAGETYTVKAGDTLYSISRKMEMTVKQVADLNGIKEPYTVRPGQKIKSKPGKGKAYVVQSGDTLSAIGRRFQVTAAQIASANDTDVGAAIRPGQRLLLPAGYRDRGPQQITVAVAAPPRPAPAPERNYQPALPPPVAPAQSRPQIAAAPPPAPPAPERNYQRVTPSPPARPVTPPPAAARPTAPALPASAPPATTLDIQSAGRGRFVWPLQGRQLGGFGSRGNNQQSNGLNIASSPGTPVRASAPGEVIYAGSELQGYGNLVLVRHDGGFVTVYAHLSRIGVKMQDRVQQGQTIGDVGQSGGVTEPQLYFEMRHQQSARDAARPFDPMLVLPR